MKKGFAECTDCRVWADIPLGFKETKHFVQCPKCKQPMYLMRMTSPDEVGLRESSKVVAGVMLHGVKL